MATEVANLTVKVDTTGVQKGERDIERMGQAAAKTTAQTDKMTTASKKSNVVVGDFGRKAGMAGVQFEQLAGQIAMGQNPMRAIGVQAADLGFILGVPLLGAVIGISAALASVFIPNTKSAAERAKELKDELRELESGFQKLTASQRLLLQLELQREIVKLSEEIDSLRSGIVTLSDIAVADQLAQQILTLGEQLDAVTGVTDEANESVDEYVASLQTELEMLGLTERAAHLYKLGQMGATEADRLAADAILQKIEAREKEIKQEQERERAAEKLKRDTLAQIDAENKRFEAAQENAERMAQLDETAMQRAERIREERLAKIEEDRQNDLISLEQYEEAKRSIQATFEEQAEQDRQERDDRRKESARMTTDALLAFEDVLLKGKSEKEKAAFRLAVNLANAEKRENARSIISNSYDAAMKAYKALAFIPIVGPALGAAAAATILAAGVSFAAQSLQGRALGGQVRAGESYVVGERGPEILTMGTGGRIIPNEAIGAPTAQTNNTTNVSFNINAQDASGFDRLLASRRGLIIQMINDAVEDQGREALV